MSGTCPCCAGLPSTTDRDRLAAFAHERWCSLLLGEGETLTQDRSALWRGHTTRERPATAAERLLLRASGLPADGVLMTRVDWREGRRMRTWRRPPTGVAS